MRRILSNQTVLTQFASPVKMFAQLTISEKRTFWCSLNFARLKIWGRDLKVIVTDGLGSVLSKLKTLQPKICFVARNFLYKRPSV